MRNLEATKAFSYGTRRLKAGDYFTTHTSADARALVALGKASHRSGDEAPKAPKAPKAAKSTPATSDPDALKKLRADYQEVLKKKPFGGWDAAELQRRIDEALK